MLLSVIGLGWLSFKALENPASEFTAAFLGILAVYVIGVLLSLVTSHPMIMKLHLLRSSAVISTPGHPGRRRACNQMAL